MSRNVPIPIITITFDDNSPTIYTEAFVRMSLLDLKGSHACITGNINGGGLITTAQIQALYDGGWDIVNHTNSHSDLTTLSAVDAEAQVSDAYDTLILNGWTRGAQEFVAPFNALNEELIHMIKGYARSCTSSTYNSNLFDRNRSPIDRYRINRQGIGTSSVETAKDWIDETIEKNYYLHLYFHGIEDPIGGTYPPDMFQEVIEYIAAKRDAGLVRIMTQSQLTDYILNDQVVFRSAWPNRLRIRDFGKSLRLTGASSGDRFDITTNAAINSITTQATLSMWVKRASSQTAAHEYLVQSNTSQWHWRIDNLSSGRLRFYWDGANSLQNGPTIPMGKWTHVAVTLSYDGTNTTAVFYLNGERYNSGTAPGAISINGKGLRIGCTTGGASGLNGWIDEFKFWNRALTGTEVKSLYDFGNVTNGLKGSYLLNEGAGTTVVDNSGNGNNGTITGATYSTDVKMIARSAV